MYLLENSGKQQIAAGSTHGLSEVRASMADTTSSVRSSSSPARASVCHGGVDGLGPLGPMVPMVPCLDGQQDLFGVKAMKSCLESHEMGWLMRCKGASLEMPI